MIEQHSEGATMHAGTQPVRVAHIRYRTEGGSAGEWAVVSDAVKDEAGARAYLAHHHPAYEFVGVRFETRSGSGVVTK